MRLLAKKCLTVAWSALALHATGADAHGSGHDARSGTAVIKEQKSWGLAADPRPGLRTIHISMNDRMRFEPDSVSVREGETVRLIIRNDGQLMHELVMGTRKELDAHAALMRKFPNMEHDEPYMVHVAPGKTGEIAWTFNRAGEFHFACLIAGHYEAGMTGRITVAPNAPTSVTRAE